MPKEEVVVRTRAVEGEEIVEEDLRRERIDVDDTSRTARGASTSTSGLTGSGRDAKRGVGERLADAADDVKDRVDGNPRSRPGPDATDSDRRI